MSVNNVINVNGELVGAVCETVLRGTHRKRLQYHYKGCMLPSDTPRGTASEDSTSASSSSSTSATSSSAATSIT
uniref:Uncharacterized protein n=1 Tax=Megaselia scalaris TaxID=36166 RepID=T1GEZ8_MEGSC